MKCLDCKKRKSEYYVPGKVVIMMLCSKCMLRHWRRDPELVMLSKDINDDTVEKNKAWEG